MSATERLIEVATEELAARNAELHLAATNELRQRIDSSQTGEIQAATIRLAARRKPHWVTILLVLMGLVSLSILAISTNYLRQLRASTGIVTFSTTGPSLEPTADLRHQEELILYGDRSKADPVAQWRALWESRPDHPPYFAEYSIRHLAELDTLPPDFLETAESIDPDNGWFLLLAAGLAAKDSVEKDPQTGEERDNHIAPSWTVVDSVEFKKALKLIHQAAEKPRYESYTTELFQERVRSFPTYPGYAGMISSLAYFAGLPAPIHLTRSSFDVLIAEVWQSAQEEDLEAYRKTQQSFNRLTKALVLDARDMIEILIAKACLRQGVLNFRDTAETLGLSDEAESYRLLELALSPPDEEKQGRRAQTSKLEQRIEQKGSILAALSLPMVARQAATQVPIREDELTPGRRAEHAILGSFAAIAVWASIGLNLAVLACYQFRHGAVIRELSRVSLRCLNRSDWAWILLGGSVAPLLWHLLVAQLSPLAAHHWNMRTSNFVSAAGQFTATLWLLMICPVVIARWRLGRRASFLGMQTNRPWIGMMALAAVALSIPLLGSIPFAGSFSNAVMFTSTALLYLAQLWWVVIAIKALFGLRQRALPRQTLARILIPAYALSMLLIILSVPLFRAIEAHWVSHDHLMEASAEEPALNRYEYRVAQQLKAELLESLSNLPSAN